MNDIAIFTAAALAWAGACFRLWALRHDSRDPALRAFWWAMAALGMALTLYTPSVYRGFDQVTGVANLAELAGHALVLLSALQAHAILLHLTATPHAQQAITRRRLAVALALAGMAVTFALAEVDQEAPGEFTARYALTPWVTEYWLIFICSLTLLLTGMVRLSLRYARLASRTPLGIGLRLVAAGGVVGIAYFLHWALYLWVRRVGSDLPGWLATALNALFLVATLLIVVGSTLPAWAPARRSDKERAEKARALSSARQLYPLWADLVRDTPEITMFRPRWRPVDGMILRCLDLDRLDLRLYRRVIEIRDARLYLAPYLDSRDADAAAAAHPDVHGVDLQVVQEAALLATGLCRRRLGQRGEAAAAAAVTGGSDIDHEVSLLKEVARAYTSPKVRALTIELARATPRELTGTLAVARGEQSTPRHSR